MSVIASHDELLPVLQTGLLLEHRYTNVELKQSWDQDDGRKLAGLANRPDEPVSWLVVGVDDKGQVIGREEGWARRTEQTLSQHVNAKLNPPIACKGIACLDAGRGWIVVVHIGHPGSVVYWGDAAYRMSGTTIHKMTPSETMELTLRLPGLTDYTKQVWNEPVLDADLTVSFAARIEGLNELTDAEECLRELRIADMQASRVLFGACRYRLVHFAVNEEVREQREGFGMARLLESAPSVIEHWSSHDERAPFPARAVREALANAVAHAAYFEQSGDITVEVHPDKLAVTNLCVPDSEFFANRWFSRDRRTINGALVEALRLAKYVDELGLGKKRIFEECILAGLRPPVVEVERAGRLNRWRLTLFGGTPDSLHLRLQARLQDIYGDRRRALVAHALILWRSESLERIRDLMGGESSRVLHEVLEHPKCPVMHLPQIKKLHLVRWVSVLLDDGRDARALSADEEQSVLRMCYQLQRKYDDGVMSAKDFRGLADFGDTKSERTTSSRILSKWVSQGYLERLAKGKYRFNQRPELENANSASGLLAEWLSTTPESALVVSE